MSLLTWLHITDLHAKGVHESDENDTWLHGRMLALIQDIHDTLIHEEVDQLDCIFFTGDLSYSGRDFEFIPQDKDHCENTARDPEETVEFFITRLKETLSPNYNPKIYIVPGNHDQYVVNRPPSSDNFVEAQSFVKSKFNEIDNDSESTQDKLEEIRSKFWNLGEHHSGGSNQNKLNDIYKNYLEEAFEHFIAFAKKEMPTDLRVGDVPGDFYAVHESLEGQTIGILGINTAYTHVSPEIDTEKKLLLSHLQLEKLATIEELQSNVANILLVHHPIETHIWNSEDAVIQQFLKQFDIVLSGHNHLSEIEGSRNNEQGTLFLTGTSIRGEEIPLTAEKNSTEEDRRNNAKKNERSISLTGYSLGFLDIEDSKFLKAQTLPRVNFQSINFENSFVPDPFFNYDRRSSKTSPHTIRKLNPELITASLDGQAYEKANAFGEKQNNPLLDDSSTHQDILHDIFTLAALSSNLNVINNTSCVSAIDLQKFSSTRLRIVLPDEVTINRLSYNLETQGHDENDRTKHLSDLFEFLEGEVKGTEVLPHEIFGNEEDRQVLTIFSLPRFVLSELRASDLEYHDDPTPDEQLAGAIRDLHNEIISKNYLLLGGTTRGSQARHEVSPIWFGDAIWTQRHLTHTNTKNKSAEDYRSLLPNDPDIYTYSIDGLNLYIFLGYSYMDLAAIMKLLENSTKGVELSIIYMPQNFKPAEGPHTRNTRKLFAMKLSEYLQAVAICPIVDNGNYFTEIYFGGQLIYPVEGSNYAGITTTPADGNPRKEIVIDTRKLRSETENRYAEDARETKKYFSEIIRRSMSQVDNI